MQHRRPAHVVNVVKGVSHVGEYRLTDIPQQRLRCPAAEEEVVEAPIRHELVHQEQRLILVAPSWMGSCNYYQGKLITLGKSLSRRLRDEMDNFKTEEKGKKANRGEERSFYGGAD